MPTRKRTIGSSPDAENSASAKRSCAEVRLYTQECVDVILTNTESQTTAFASAARAHDPECLDTSNEKDNTNHAEHPVSSDTSNNADKVCSPPRDAPEISSLMAVTSTGHWEQWWSRVMQVEATNPQSDLVDDHKDCIPITTYKRTIKQLGQMVAEEAIRQANQTIQRQEEELREKNNLIASLENQIKDLKTEHQAKIKNSTAPEYTIARLKKQVAEAKQQHEELCEFYDGKIESIEARLNKRIKELMKKNDRFT